MPACSVTYNLRNTMFFAANSSVNARHAPYSATPCPHTGCTFSSSNPGAISRHTRACQLFVDSDTPWDMDGNWTGIGLDPELFDIIPSVIPSIRRQHRRYPHDPQDDDGCLRTDVRDESDATEPQNDGSARRVRFTYRHSLLFTDRFSSNTGTMTFTCRYVALGNMSYNLHAGM